MTVHQSGLFIYWVLCWVVLFFLVVLQVVLRGFLWCCHCLCQSGPRCLCDGQREPELDLVLPMLMRYCARTR